MFASALITLREGLEAALIVGIVLGVLRKMGRRDRSRSVWAGVLAAVAVSVGAGLAFNALGVAFEGRGEAIFEGFAMLLAAGVLTWMIFWMARQSRSMKADLERDVRQASATGSSWALFSLTFVAVLREGIELALFLTAAALATSTSATLLGGIAGLLAAVVAGGLVFATTKHLNVRTFFRVTSVLLIVFAAGLVAHGIHEFNEAGLVPSIVEHVWDLNPVLDENSTGGELLKALFGYNGNPSLTEVVSYAGYWLVITLVLWRKREAPRQVPAYSGGE